MNMHRTVLGVICLFLVVLFFAAATNAQTTTFSFQGNLPKEITPATHIYEMEFRLMDAFTGGTQIGPTNVISAVEVKAHDFSVWLDFGSASFSGADRFVEVSVRRSGSTTPFNIIRPRTPILSVPYSIRALTSATADNALAVGGVSGEELVQTTDARLSDSRDPNPGSNNYIQNTTTQQSGANFNISGNGTAGGTLSGAIVNAAGQYNIGGSRALTVAGTGNVFAGIGAGQSNTTGSENSFFGRSAGLNNTTGFANSFFGRSAGANTTTGSENSFFGRDSGGNNSTGSNNAFFGSLAGRSNTTGSSNSFFGRLAGESNTTGTNNIAFGFRAGENNTTGDFNNFLGSLAGNANTIGIRNSFLGTNSGRANTEGNDNSFFGTNTGLNNTTGVRNSIFGSLAGIANIVGTDNSFFGTNSGANTIGSNNSFFGVSSGLSNTEGVDNAFFGMFAGSSNTTGNGNSYFGNRARGSAGVVNATAIGSRAFVTQNNSLVLGGIGGVNGGSDTNVGIGTTAPLDRLHVNGMIRVSTLGAAGTTQLCRNASNQISDCSNPRSQGGQVASEGRIVLDLVQELQAQIERQKAEIDTLKRFICSQNPTAEICPRSN